LLNTIVQKEMLAPAVKGTRNVLEACSAASVQKLVVVSSICAVCFNPSLPRDRLIDETCWSDKKSCKENEVRNWPLLLFSIVSFSLIHQLVIRDDC
jgi:nucleoside-diphosphate-sugar epimerase